MADITIPIAFAAGVLSFLSPCILPLVPAYLSYLAGTSTGPSGEQQKPSKKKVFMNALMFVVGFSLVFSILGILLASVLSTAAFDARILLTVLGGSIIIGFGFYLTLVNLGVKKPVLFSLLAVLVTIFLSSLNPDLDSEIRNQVLMVGGAGIVFLVGYILMGRLGINVPFFGSTHRIAPKKFGSSYLSSFVFGVAFAAGWTPCIGAVLGGILTLAILEPGSAFNLMLAFSMGIGLPFLIAGAFISQFSSFIARFANVMRYFSISMGVVLILVGILVVTGFLGSLSSFIPAELAEFENLVLG